jgi:hypothetical protein
MAVEIIDADDPDVDRGGCARIAHSGASGKAEDGQRKEGLSHRASLAKPQRRRKRAVKMQ